MKNLSVKYLGLELKNPVVVSSSSLTGSVDKIKKCEASGAGAVVLKSLFEEQIMADQGKLMDQSEMYFWYPEALDFVNNIAKEGGVDSYLELIKQAKASVDIPVIASINCVSDNDWVKFTSKIEEAGADAIELNVSIPASEPNVSGQEIENIYLSIAKKVKASTNLPVSMKIGSYFSNPANFIMKLDETGIDGIVMFNRFYTPDIDTASLKTKSDKIYSGASEYTLPLRWIALMADKVKADLSASTGIKTGETVVKQILAGASSVQICSVVYEKGFNRIEEIVKEIESWLEIKQEDSLSKFKGAAVKDKAAGAAFERVQFMKRTAGVE